MSTGVRQLVGRKRELALLERELTRLERQQGGVLQIVGEPGIGKTRLIYEALDRAARMQYTTLVGRGDEFQRDMPFGIFVDALDDHLAMLSTQIEQSLPPAHLLQLGLVFPSLSAIVTGDVGPATQRSSPGLPRGAAAARAAGGRAADGAGARRPALGRPRLARAVLVSRPQSAARRRSDRRGAATPVDLAAVRDRSARRRIVRIRRAAAARARRTPARCFRATSIVQRARRCWRRAAATPSISSS